MERFNKTVKKILAFTGGAVFLASTMAGALAALDSLPQPFVTSAGVFDSYVVVGDKAAAKDIVSGMDVAAAFAQKATSAVSGASTAASVSSGVLVQLSGEKLFYGEDVADKKSTITSTDLDILADGSYKDTKGANSNDVKYTQKLTFPAGTATMEFTKNTQATPDNDPYGTYLVFDKSEDYYNYTLKFSTAVKYSNESDDTATTDLKNTKLTIEGKAYTISEAALSSGEISKLVLLSGSTTANQGEYTTQTYTVNGKTYEVEVTGISSTKAVFKVNGEVTDPIEENGVYTLSSGDNNGLELGVNYIMAIDKAGSVSQVSFYLGAQKLILEKGEEIQLNDATIDGYKTAVEFTSKNDGGSKSNSLDKIVISVQPTDAHFLAAGESLVDPVFGNWKFVYSGMEADYEEYTVSTSGTSGTVSIINTDGKVVDIPAVLDDASDKVVLGSDFDMAAKITTAFAGATANQAMFVSDNDVYTDANQVDTAEGLKILAAASNGELHLLELTKVDVSKNKYSIKDYTDKVTHEDLEFNTTQDVAGLTTFELDIYGDDAIAAKKIWGPATAGEFKTNKGAIVDFELNNSSFVTGTSWAGVQFKIADEKGMNATVFNLVEKGATDDEMQVKDVKAADGAAILFKENKDSKEYVGIDQADSTGISYGIKFKWNEDTRQDLSIMYPDNKVEHAVYVAPVSATSVTGSSGSVSVNYINAAVGISKLDTDFATSAPTKNVILVGGPAVNTLVSGLAAEGKTWTTAEWQNKADTAVVELVENAFGSYEALIIAGYDAKDTSLASKVVASRLAQGQFADKLVGSKVVIGTAGASVVNEVSFS